MPPKHHKGGGGRYYKDEGLRRGGRRYYSQYNNYSSYNSYPTNQSPYSQPSTPSPYSQPSTASNQTQPSTQSPNGQQSANPFSSRRSDTVSLNNVNVPHQDYKSATNNWYYNTSHGKRSNGYLGNRPRSTSTLTTQHSRRGMSGVYREDNQRYPDYNGYSPYTNSHDSYPGKPPFGKGKYHLSNHLDEYRDFNSHRQELERFPSKVESTIPKSEDEQSYEPEVMEREVKREVLYKENGALSKVPTNNEMTETQTENVEGDTTDNPKLTVDDKLALDSRNDNMITDQIKEASVLHEKEPSEKENPTLQENLSVPSQEDIASTRLDTAVTEQPVTKNEPSMEKPQDGIKSESSDVHSNLDESSHPEKKKIETTFQTGEDGYPEIEGCIFPMLKNEYRVWELKHHPKSKRIQNLKYLNESKLTRLSQYSFWNKALLVFQQADAFLLFNTLKEIQTDVKKKETKLLEHFVYQNYIWKKAVSFCDKQLEEVYGVPEKEPPKVEEKPEPRSHTSRRSRHHGDSVRTEAEFMEILATLEQERERDPLIKAQYGAAIIPDMIMDPIEKYAMTRVMDSNNLIKDKEAWAKRIITDPIDTFTEVEHERFCELYALHPKKFGRISYEMGGLRTSEDCVLHYYNTKKTTNYKQLVANKNKKNKKKVAKKKKDNKGRADTSTPDTSTVENEVQKQASSVKPDIDESGSEQGNKRKILTIDIPMKQRKVSQDSPINSTGTDSIGIIVPPPKESVTPVTETPKVCAIKKDNLNSSLLDVKSELTETETISHIGTQDSSHHSNIQGTNIDEPHTQSTAETCIEDRKAKKPKKHDEKPHHISSYWSVHDINKFPLLLEQHGSNWERIAAELGTKSSTMVKNYYQRGLVDHPEWQEIVKLKKESDGAKQDNHAIQQDTMSLKGPSMGYFYKPNNGYSSQFPYTATVPQISSHVPSQQVMSSIPVEGTIHNPKLPSLESINDANPVYRPIVVDNFPSISTGIQKLPLPPHQFLTKPPPVHSLPIPSTRNNIMNMSSLLNASAVNDEMNQMAVPIAHGLPHMNTSYHQSQAADGRLNLMNLLNSPTNPRGDEKVPQVPPFVNSQSTFQPSISSMMNPLQQPPILEQHTVSPSQPQMQQEKPLDQVPQQRNAYTGGTSALDALARIAFERK